LGVDGESDRVKQRHQDASLRQLLRLARYDRVLTLCSGSARGERL
jgi:hypothetical protein